MADARIWFVLLTAVTTAWSLVTAGVLGRPGWVSVPADRIRKYAKLAQRAVYIASRDNRYLYRVVAINEVRSRPEGIRKHIQMKLKVAESVCLTENGVRPKRACPRRHRAPVRSCELDIIRGSTLRFVHVYMDCERPHH